MYIYIYTYTYYTHILEYCTYNATCSGGLRIIFIPTPSLPLFNLFMFVVASEGASRRTPSVLPARPASGDSLVEIQRRAHWIHPAKLLSLESLKGIRRVCSQSCKGRTKAMFSDKFQGFAFWDVPFQLLSPFTPFNPFNPFSYSAFRPLSPATRFQAETTSAYGQGS